MLRQRHVQVLSEVGPADDGGAGPSGSDSAAAPPSAAPASPTPGRADADPPTRPSRRSPPLPTLPPDAPFAQAGRAGKFVDARVEAAFWEDRDARLRGRDAAALAAFGGLQAGILVSHRAGFPPGSTVPTVAAVLVGCGLGCLSSLARWGPRRPFLARFADGLFIATLGVLRSSDAPWTYLVTPPHSPAALPAPVFRSARLGGDAAAAAAARVPSVLVLLRAPAVVCLAVLTAGLDAPPLRHCLGSAACLAIGAALFPRIVRMRIIMHGTAVHVNAAAGLSSLTWALGATRPGAGAPGPRLMDPLRATMAVTTVLYLVVGAAIPSTIAFADQRWARARFRLRHEEHGSPAAAAAAATAARRRCADAALLDLAVLAGFVVGLWALIEEVDAAWPVAGVKGG